MKRFSVLLLLGACATNTIAPVPATMSVGGTYTTGVSMVSPGCPSPSFQSFPTTVTHTPGATSLSVAHAGQVYSGTLQANAQFSTTPKLVAGNFTITISGAFTTTTLDAQAVVADAAQGCSYTLRWFGPKQGAPNVIP